MKFQKTTTKSLVLALVVSAISSAVVFSAVILSRNPQFRRSFASTSNAAQFLIFPTNRTLTPNSTQEITIWITLDQERQLDGIQYDLSVTGVNSSQISLETSSPSSNSQTFTTRSGNNFKAAYISTNPDSPFTLPGTTAVMIGTLVINTPDSGSITLSLNNSNSKVYEHNNTENILASINPITYSVGTPDTSNLQVLRLDLINADTDQTVRPLNPIDTININDLPNFNLEAITTEQVESVTFDYDGTRRTEVFLPYAIDHNGPSFFEPWQITPGDYKITITPYSQDNAQGASGQPVEYSLTITNQDTTPTVTNLYLVNTDTNQTIRQVGSAEIINLAQTPNISIAAEANEYTESIQFSYNSFTQTEDIAPFAIAGDDNGEFTRWDINPGTYQIQVQPFSQDGATGTSGPARTINLEVINQTGDDTRVPPPPTPTPPSPSPTPTPTNPDFEFVLITAGPNSNEEIKVLRDGETISKSQYGDFSLKLGTFPSGTDSVQFTSQNIDQLENYEPYALRGNQLNNVNNWDPDIGQVTIRATAYSQNGANGQELGSTEIRLQITQ